MKPHVLYHPMDPSEKPYMAELIHLIMANGLELKLFLNILQVIAGSGNGRNARARKADF